MLAGDSCAFRLRGCQNRGNLTPMADTSTSERSPATAHHYRCFDYSAINAAASNYNTTPSTPGFQAFQVDG